MCGKYFESFIDQHFERLFQAAGKGDHHLPIQDGDPSQNSALVRVAMQRAQSKLKNESNQNPRSCDVLCIKNFFVRLKNYSWLEFGENE